MYKNGVNTKHRSQDGEHLSIRLHTHQKLSKSLPSRCWIVTGQPKTKRVSMNLAISFLLGSDDCGLCTKIFCSAGKICITRSPASSSRAGATSRNVFSDTTRSFTEGNRDRSSSHWMFSTSSSQLRGLRISIIFTVREDKAAS